jgi:hypothetical protein
MSFIGEFTRLICDIIEKCDESNISGVLILLDFEKAFDSVEWNYDSLSLGSRQVTSGICLIKGSDSKIV